MDKDQFQENWSTLCRKFPVVLFCSVKDMKQSISIIRDACHQFDHVIFFVEKEFLERLSEDLKQFSSDNRIINLSLVDSSVLNDDGLEARVTSVCRSNFKNCLSVICHNNDFSNSMRWKIYDKVKEMKSPFSDVLSLDKDCNSVLRNPSYTVSWNHGA